MNECVRTLILRAGALCGPQVETSSPLARLFIAAPFFFDVVMAAILFFCPDEVCPLMSVLNGHART